MPESSVNKFAGHGRKRTFIAVIAIFSALICVFHHASTATASDPGGHPNDILIVSNKAVSEVSVSRLVARDLFLRVRKEWQNGRPVIPLIPADEALRSAFRKKVLNMDAADEKQYWRDAKLRHGLVHPPVVARNIRAVFDVRNGVSYVFRKDYREGVVKIICVVPAKN